MKKNVGNIDAVIRTDLAFVLSYIYFNNPGIKSTLAIIGLLLAAHLLATAVFGTEPLYKLFKISTVGLGEGKKTNDNQ
ncbi:MAG: DUF2892 domain-containing protein [Candidatus Pacebacteria bacterium]|nr:DUF2892 domain-containing protein [Candidatus Paceibacterota bacterium]